MLNEVEKADVAVAVVEVARQEIIKAREEYIVAQQLVLQANQAIEPGALAQKTLPQQYQLKALAGMAQLREKDVLAKLCAKQTELANLEMYLEQVRTSTHYESRPALPANQTDTLKDEFEVLTSRSPRSPVIRLGNRTFGRLGYGDLPTKEDFGPCERNPALEGLDTPCTNPKHTHQANMW